MMKTKILSLCLALLIMFTLVSCSPSGSTTTEGTAAGTTTTEEGFIPGEAINQTYESKFIGLGCRLNAEWLFHSEAQIRELNKIVENVSGDAYKEALKNAQVVYDMYATHTGYTDNIIVTLEKIDNTKLEQLDLSANYEAVFPTIQESFENMGYTDITHTVGTVQIGGKDYTSMTVTAKIAGMQMNQLNFCIKCNGYLASVAITSMDAATLQNVLSSFYLLP